jgi:hypothetical protein
MSIVVAQFEYQLRSQPVSRKARTGRLAVRGGKLATVGPVCERCKVLSDRLKGCMKLLDEAVARMRSLVGAKKPEEFAALLRETESQRMECEAIRAELDRHKRHHGELPNRNY